jgi:hypothetical protein
MTTDDQLTETDVKRLFRENKYRQIEQARIDGRLDDVLGITRHRPPVEGQWTSDDLSAMYREGRNTEIDTARGAGQLDTLLGTPPTEPKE